MTSYIKQELSPGSYVIYTKFREWGIGQIQSCIDNIVTVNFENVGKKVMNIKKVNLEVIEL